MPDDCEWKTQSQNKTDMNIPFEVVTQGAPVVSDRRAHIWAKSDNIIYILWARLQDPVHKHSSSVFEH